ncbi:MAG: LysR family transcriptional regulator [Hyphomicrobiales bacterium]|nr:LysR family transcriptional regulator [Hyphomicrobiales bacterium]
MADLDIELLRTFVALAETESFTAAGLRLGATQSTISVRLKKLEDRLGRRLFERTPRAVLATPFGEAFQVDARRILALHDDAVARATCARPLRRISLGVSEHATGGRLPMVMKALHGAVPDLQIAVTLGSSEDLRDDFENGRFEAVVIRRTLRDGGPSDGRRLFVDDLVWAMSPDCPWTPGRTIPLVAIARPCRVHEHAHEALTRSGLPFYPAFVSRDLVAVQAAVAAGLGVGCLGRSAAPEGAMILGPGQGFPELPQNEIVLFAVRDASLAPIFERLAEAFRRLPAVAARPLEPA